MGMHKGMIGKIGPGSADVTLGDYIARKQQATAFDEVAKEKKLTFDEWHNQNRYKWQFNNDVPSWVDDVVDQTLVECWKAAQENK